jgi:hypothetical protein
MSGDGVISVRMPRSLLEVYRAGADAKGLTIHDAARSVIDDLPDLTAEELDNLKEPPQEDDSPRVSLYVGRRYVDALNEVTCDSTLSVSSIFRRILYGLLVSGTVEFVQNGDGSYLTIVPSISQK